MKEDVYKWEYQTEGNGVYCVDKHDRTIHAMCANSELAKIICNLLNSSRKKEQRL